MVKKTPEFLDPKQALACVHCGLCLGSCPTYLETGNENESPRGRIYLMRALQEGRLEANPSSVGHLDLCLGCRACETACPSGVRYGHLLESTRAFLARNYERSWRDALWRTAIAQLFPFPRRLFWAARLGTAARRIRFLFPAKLRSALELLPESSVSARLPECAPALGTSRGRVGLIRGCVMSALFGQTHRATIRLLNAAGYDVLTPRGQVCCGALHAHAGELGTARRFARRNVAAFERLGVEALVVNAAGCGSTLKEYGDLLAGDPIWAPRAARFSAAVKDLSEWLARAGMRWERRNGLGKVAFHDACHLAHAQRITEEPRQLARAVAGDQMIELPEADLCCGSAGSYNLTAPEMAEGLQRRKVENILKSGAACVVTTNPGCILQIQAGLKKAGAHGVRVLHLAEFLDQQGI